MTSDQELEGYARECVRLAHLTSDPHIREQLFEMARAWMAAAMREEKRPKRGGTRRKSNSSFPQSTETNS
jgi:hypothetical protein